VACRRALGVPDLVLAIADILNIDRSRSPLQDAQALIGGNNILCQMAMDRAC